MSKGKRLSILAEAEIEELYSPPVFSESDQQTNGQYHHLLQLQGAEQPVAKL
jgi:hypothetical protein